MLREAQAPPESHSRHQQGRTRPPGSPGPPSGPGPRATRAARATGPGHAAWPAARCWRSRALRGVRAHAAPAEAQPVGSKAEARPGAAVVLEVQRWQPGGDRTGQDSAGGAHGCGLRAWGSARAGRTRSRLCRGGGAAVSLFSTRHTAGTLRTDPPQGPATAPQPSPSRPGSWDPSTGPKPNPSSFWLSPLRLINPAALICPGSVPAGRQGSSCRATRLPPLTSALRPEGAAAAPAFPGVSEGRPGGGCCPGQCRREPPGHRPEQPSWAPWSPRAAKVGLPASAWPRACLPAPGLSPCPEPGAGSGLGPPAGGMFLPREQHSAPLQLRCLL